MPPLLDAIADLLRGASVHRDETEETERLAICHAEARLTHGFDLEEVTAEYASLRRTVIRLWGQTRGTLEEREVRLFDDVIDQAVAVAVRSYVESRTRTLQALDRISTVVLRADRLDDLLQQLLDVAIETMPVVDTAAILLVEGHRLRMHALVSLDHAKTGDDTILIGEGFAGSIAAHKTSRHLVGHEIDRVVVDPALRGKGLEALYGVPFIVDGEVIGVAHMGSLTAAGFSNEDITLFTAMAERASTAVHQHAIRQESARLIEILEAGDPCLTLDAQWRITFVNDGQQRISRTPASRSIGRRFWDVWPQTADPKSNYWIEYHRVMQERIPVEFEEYYAPLDLWTHVTAYPTRDGGIAIFFRDANERKELEEARDRFIAVLGHDLRTPLTAINMTAATLLERGSLDPTAKKSLSRITSASTRMARIISDVLDWAAVGHDQGLKISYEHVDLASVCERVVAEIRAAHPGRVVDFTREGTCEGLWDSGRMAQVVSNLVANAIQHGAPRAPIRVTLRDLGEDIILEVHNEGSPIPADRIPRLFDPFASRPDPASSGSKHRLGLGLYIVGQIVAAHRGTVDLDSRIDTGTTFRVRLPKSPAGRD